MRSGSAWPTPMEGLAGADSAAREAASMGVSARDGAASAVVDFISAWGAVGGGASGAEAGVEAGASSTDPVILRLRSASKGENAGLGDSGGRAGSGGVVGRDGAELALVWRVVVAAGLGALPVESDVPRGSWLRNSSTGRRRWR